jgi:hypothetical protein
MGRKERPLYGGCLKPSHSLTRRRLFSFSESSSGFAPSLIQTISRATAFAERLKTFGANALSYSQNRLSLSTAFLFR